MIDQRDLGQFQSQLERFLGMGTHIHYSNEREAVLGLITETGVCLGEIKCFNDKGRWQFAGTSSLLPNDWQNLCRL